MTQKAKNWISNIVGIIFIILATWYNFHIMSPEEFEAKMEDLQDLGFILIVIGIVLAVAFPLLRERKEKKE